jgi:hypothetical protein
MTVLTPGIDLYTQVVLLPVHLEKPVVLVPDSILIDERPLLKLWVGNQ